jgi:transposase InsO family protein
MRAYFQILLYVLASVFKSRRRLAAENIALRHQILLLKRKHRGRIKLRGLDRFILGWLSRIVPAVADTIIIVKPETLVRWHRLGFRAFWHWKSRPVGGRPPVGKELRALILRMAAENPLWGAPRIHGELLKLGFELAQSTVSNYLRRNPRPRGQTWKTFIDNHNDAIAATDLFVVPTISFRLMYGIVIVHLKRRELVWTNATLHPTAEWIAQQLTEAYIERYNRTVRHEWLDQYMFATIKVVQDYATSWLWTYNNDRPNMGLGGITPVQKLKQKTAA